MKPPRHADEDHQQRQFASSGGLAFTSTTSRGGTLDKLIHATGCKVTIFVACCLALSVVGLRMTLGTTQRERAPNTCLTTTVESPRTDSLPGTLQPLNVSRSPPLSPLSASSRPRLHRRVHLQLVVLTDSILGASSGVFDNTTATRYSRDLLRAMFYGRGRRRGRGINMNKNNISADGMGMNDTVESAPLNVDMTKDKLQTLLNSMRNLLAMSKVVDEKAWTRALHTLQHQQEQQGSSSSECLSSSSLSADHDGEKRGRRRCLVSVGAAALDLPSHDTMLFSLVTEECLTYTSTAIAGDSTLLPVLSLSCKLFLSTLQSDMQRASKNGADEVIFVVVSSVGVNNIWSEPDSWSPYTEAQRVRRTLEALVERLLGYQKGSRDKNNYGAADRRTANKTTDVTTDFSEFRVAPLFYFRFRGSRRVVMLPTELSTVWAFESRHSGGGGNKVPSPPLTQAPFRSPFQTSRQQRHQAQHDQLQQNWINQYKAMMSGVWFPEAAPMCHSHGQSGWNASWCDYVCWLTSTLPNRPLRYQRVNEFSVQLRDEMEEWRQELRNHSQAASVSRFRILLGRGVSGCGENEREQFVTAQGKSTQCSGRGESLASLGTARNYRDCLHYSVNGARRAAMLMVEGVLRTLSDVLF